jgi:hypothetical protein
MADSDNDKEALATRCKLCSGEYARLRVAAASSASDSGSPALPSAPAQ